MSSRRILVTGAAGFIGFHVCRRLLEAGDTVLGFDNFDSFYDVRLKERRAAILDERPAFTLIRESIQDAAALSDAWAGFRPDMVIHLAAQAGVRDSTGLANAYLGANIVGSFNVLEAARYHPVGHLLIASTSSVYGANTELPFSEGQPIQRPISVYAATKGAVELIGHSYSHLFGTPITMFRFFTVYGPWGRPDMALFKFTRAIIEGRPIDIYNNGSMIRDFTYIDDLVESIWRLIHVVPGQDRVEGDSLSEVAPFRVVNVGGGRPECVSRYIEELEHALGRQAMKNYLPLQQGEVLTTDASPALLQRLTGYVPTTSLREGIARFVAWYLDFHGC